MDPTAALTVAETALQHDDRAGARRALADYVSWRRRGGFAPPDGDARAARLHVALARRGYHAREALADRLADVGREQVPNDGPPEWDVHGGL